MKKFLVIGPAWIGDMVMAQGLFISLKSQYPEAIIDVLASDWTRPLLDRMPEVTHMLPLPFKHGQFSLISRLKLGKSLQAKHYDEAIVLPNSWKSALVPFAANIPKRTGWLGECRVGLLNNFRVLNKSNKKKYPLMIERFIALSHTQISKTKIENIKTFYPKLKININNLNTALKKYNLNTDKPIIVLCPGAEFGPSKRWPENYYAEVANNLLDKNFQIWLMGSQNDKDITEKINILTQNRCNNLAGQTSLAEAVDLLSLAYMVITNDSGLMHITAALDRPLIAIYGSTDPGFTPPLSDKAKIISIDLPCRPCFQRNCPLKHHRCMKDLSPTRVLEIFEQCAY